MEKVLYLELLHANDECEKIISLACDYNTNSHCKCSLRNGVLRVDSNIALEHILINPNGDIFRYCNGTTIVTRNQSKIQKLLEPYWIDKPVPHIVNCVSVEMKERYVKNTPAWNYDVKFVSNKKVDDKKISAVIGVVGSMLKEDNKEV